TNMSPITEAMKPSRNSDRQSCASSGELFPKNGTAFATESPTTFVSSRPTIFGSSRRAGILENKVAIVTGAASGIGKDIAMLFAREGARVVIADLNQKGADAVAAELGGAKRAIGVAVDVTNEAQTETCVAKTIEAFGRLDILVSNAGI